MTDDTAFEAAWKLWIEASEKTRYRPSMRDAGRAMWDARGKRADEERERLREALSEWHEWAETLGAAFSLNTPSFKERLGRSRAALGGSDD